MNRQSSKNTRTEFFLQEQANLLQNRLRPIRWHDSSNRELELLSRYGKTEAIRSRASLELEVRSLSESI